MVATQLVPFPCYYPACTKAFSTKFNLRRHVNVSHLSIRAFQCPVCSKHFASKQNLREHGFIHTGEKPFVCQFEGCDRRYRQASQLAFHRRCHYKQGSHKAYECCVGSILAQLAGAADCTMISGLLPLRADKSLLLPAFSEDRRLALWKLPIAPSLLP